MTMGQPDTSFLAYLTAATYWALILCWTAILVFYIREYRRLRRLNPLIATLIIFIFIDGARTLIESWYFGAWYTARTDTILPFSAFVTLTKPQFVIMPKLVNLAAALILIIFLVRRWFSGVEDETQRHLDLARYHRELLQAHADLKRASAELQRSNTELEQFAYVASHDLQEPLRKIMTFGDRLEARHTDELGDRGRDYLGRMQNAARRMHARIADLLEYSRVTTRAQPFTAVDLNEVASEVVSDLQVAIERSGARVDVARLPTIDADPAQMHQLLQNLISNALKFGSKDRAPIVTVRGRLREAAEAADAAEGPTGAMCQLVVEDNGVGFDEAQSERIFGVFERLHGRAEYEGTGIGLAICRKVAKRHGGSIAAESTPGAGSTFTVMLPVRQHSAEAPASASHAPAAVGAAT